MEKKISGIMVYYYVVCKRKLWFFAHNITMEENSEAVKLGKLLDENSYSRMDKHIMIGDALNIDYLSDERVVHEIKKSRKIEEASVWQVKYYIYCLKQMGVEGVTGQIDYPLLRQSVMVELASEDEQVLLAMLAEIEEIAAGKKPLGEKKLKKKCEKCAYFDLCYI
jgi:CRISPR-associated exonuclease Cas4